MSFNPLPTSEHHVADAVIVKALHGEVAHFVEAAAVPVTKTTAALETTTNARRQQLVPGHNLQECKRGQFSAVDAHRGGQGLEFGDVLDRRTLSRSETGRRRPIGTDDVHVALTLPPAAVLLHITNGFLPSGFAEGSCLLA